MINGYNIFLLRRQAANCEKSRTRKKIGRKKMAKKQQTAKGTRGKKKINDNNNNNETKMPTFQLYKLSSAGGWL